MRKDFGVRGLGGLLMVGEHLQMRAAIHATDSTIARAVIAGAAKIDSGPGRRWFLAQRIRT